MKKGLKQKKILNYFFLTFMCIGINGIMPGTKAQPGQIDFSRLQNGQIEYVPGEILVKYKDSVSTQSASTSAVSQGHLIKKEIKHEGKGPMQVLGLAPNEDIIISIKRIQNDPNVEYAQPNYIYHMTTNDAYYSEQWALKNIGQQVPAGSGPFGTYGKDISMEAVWSAWPVLKNCSAVTIAVLDSGIDSANPDFAGNLATGTYSCPGGTGTIGCDFVLGGSPNPADGNGHGTHVSGIIGAVGQNAAGITGVCQSARILTVRVLDNNGSGTTTDIIEGLNFAVGTGAGQGGAKVVNLSLGGSGYDPALLSAIENAKSLGAILIVAAGNGGADGIGDDHTVSPVYPCDFASENIVCVTAVDQNYQRAIFADFDSNPDPSHRNVDLGAPGVNILSTWRTIAVPPYAFANGTSSAAPFVSGVAAVLFTYNSLYTYADAASVLIFGGDPETSMSGITQSGNVLDAYQSLISLPAPRNIQLKAL